MVHDCSQGTTLATICQQLKNIEESIEEMKENQRTYISDQKQLAKDIIEINREIATRPTSKEQRDAIRKVEAHDIFFAIIYAVVGICIAVFVGVATGAFRALLGLG
jgi:CHASE3 domain sensor protein